MALSPIDQLVDDALSSINAGEGVRALSILDQFVAQNPHDSVGHWLRARVLMDTDHLEEAITEARRAVDLDPENVDAQFTLGCVAWRYHDLVEARRSLQIATRLAINDGAVLSTYAHFLSHHGSPFEAASTALHAICIDAGQPRAWVALGRTQLKMGQQDAARTSIRRAMAIEPRNEHAKSVLALWRDFP